MRDIQLSGSIKVAVDAVDTEQTIIENPGLFGCGEAAIALYAACNNAGFISFDNQIKKSGHMLTYKGTERADDAAGVTYVIFDVMPRSVAGGRDQSMQLLKGGQGNE